MTDTQPEASTPEPDSSGAANAAPDEVVDVDAEVGPETDDAPDGSDATQPGAEAARYRRRLRDAENERDTLAARVEALQRAQVEALLARERMTPAALWATTELADLLADDGLVDPAKVRQAAGAARQELGITSGSTFTPATPAGGQFVSAFQPNLNR